jgi:hypothetical protein
VNLLILAISQTTYSSPTSPPSTKIYLHRSFAAGDRWGDSESFSNDLPRGYKEDSGVNGVERIMVSTIHLSKVAKHEEL